VAHCIAKGPATGEDIEALVEQLASPNQAPTVEGPDAIYPPGYDETSQVRVLEARGRLEKVIIEAFPCLLKHFEDKRYSFTQDNGEAEGNWSVGQTCVTLLRRQLQPYAVSCLGDRARGKIKFDPRERPIRPNYLKHNNLWDPKAAAAWWEQRKDKSLRELQLEALQWVLAEEQKAPKQYSEEDRAYLKELISKLEAGTEPLPPASWPVAK
jgi:hypothetical protein